MIHWPSGDEAPEIMRRAYGDGPDDGPDDGWFEAEWAELERQQEDLRWGWRGLWLGYALLLAGCLLLAATVRDGEARLRQARPTVRSAR